MLFKVKNLLNYILLERIYYSMNKRKTYMQIASMLSLINQIGIMILICILGCTFIGRFLDSKLNTSPILTLIFILLGIGGAFMGAYKTLIVYTKRK